MRKAKPKKRIILPDPKYNDVLVTKFVNNLMMGGKKTIAYKIFYEAIDVVADRTKEDGLEVWKKALANITPSVEVKSRRIGGATFQVPTEIRPERKQSTGCLQGRRRRLQAQRGYPPYGRGQQGFLALQILILYIHYLYSRFFNQSNNLKRCPIYT